MEQNVKKKTFNKRGFISVAMLLSGLCLPFSGIMNHKLQFEQLTTARHFWMSVHNVASLLFVIFVVLHITYNWRSLLTYARKTKDMFFSKETIAAIAIVLVVVGLFASHAFHVG